MSIFKAFGCVNEPTLRKPASLRRSGHVIHKLNLNLKDAQSPPPGRRPRRSNVYPNSRLPTARLTPSELEHPEPQRQLISEGNQAGPYLTPGDNSRRNSPPMDVPFNGSGYYYCQDYGYPSQFGGFPQRQSEYDGWTEEYPPPQQDWAVSSFPSQFPSAQARLRTATVYMRAAEPENGREEHPVTNDAVKVAIQQGAALSTADTGDAPDRAEPQVDESAAAAVDAAKDDFSPLTSSPDRSPGKGGQCRDHVDDVAGKCHCQSCTPSPFPTPPPLEPTLLTIPPLVHNAQRRHAAQRELDRQWQELCHQQRAANDVQQQAADDLHQQRAAKDVQHRAADDLQQQRAKDLLQRQVADDLQQQKAKDLVVEQQAADKLQQQKAKDLLEQQAADDLQQQKAGPDVTKGGIKAQVRTDMNERKLRTSKIDELFTQGEPSSARTPPPRNCSMKTARTGRVAQTASTLRPTCKRQREECTNNTRRNIVDQGAVQAKVSDGAEWQTETVESASPTSSPPKNFDIVLLHTKTEFQTVTKQSPPPQKPGCSDGEPSSTTQDVTSPLTTTTVVQDRGSPPRKAPCKAFTEKLNMWERRSSPKPGQRTPGTIQAKPREETERRSSPKPTQRAQETIQEKQREERSSPKPGQRAQETRQAKQREETERCSSSKPVQRTPKAKQREESERCSSSKPVQRTPGTIQPTQREESERQSFSRTSEQTPPTVSAKQRAEREWSSSSRQRAPETVRRTRREEWQGQNPVTVDSPSSTTGLMKSHQIVASGGLAGEHGFVDSRISLKLMCPAGTKIQLQTSSPTSSNAAPTTVGEASRRVIQANCSGGLVHAEPPFHVTAQSLTTNAGLKQTSESVTTNNPSHSFLAQPKPFSVSEHPTLVDGQINRSALESNTVPAENQAPNIQGVNVQSLPAVSTSESVVAEEAGSGDQGLPINVHPHIANVEILPGVPASESAEDEQSDELHPKIHPHIGNTESQAAVSASESVVAEEAGSGDQGLPINVHPHLANVEILPGVPASESAEDEQADEPHVGNTESLAAGSASEGFVAEQAGSGNPEVPAKGNSQPAVAAQPPEHPVQTFKAPLGTLTQQSSDQIHAADQPLATKQPEARLGFEVLETAVTLPSQTLGAEADELADPTPGCAEGSQTPINCFEVKPVAEIVAAANADNLLSYAMSAQCSSVESIQKTLSKAELGQDCSSDFCRGDQPETAERVSSKVDSTLPSQSSDAEQVMSAEALTHRSDETPAQRLVFSRGEAAECVSDYITPAPPIERSDDDRSDEAPIPNLTIGQDYKASARNSIGEKGLPKKINLLGSKPETPCTDTFFIPPACNERSLSDIDSARRSQWDRKISDDKPNDEMIAAKSYDHKKPSAGLKLGGLELGRHEAAAEFPRPFTDGGRITRPRWTRSTSQPPVHILRDDYDEMKPEETPISLKTVCRRLGLPFESNTFPVPAWVTKVSLKRPLTGDFDSRRSSVCGDSGARKVGTFRDDLDSTLQAELNQKYGDSLAEFVRLQKGYYAVIRKIGVSRHISPDLTVSQATGLGAICTRHLSTVQKIVAALPDEVFCYVHVEISFGILEVSVLDAAFVCKYFGRAALAKWQTKHNHYFSKKSYIRGGVCRRGSSQPPSPRRGSTAPPTNCALWRQGKLERLECFISFFERVAPHRAPTAYELARVANA